MSKKLLQLIAVGILATTHYLTWGANLTSPFSKGITAVAVQDTLPPMKDRKADFISDPNRNPFDLKDPSIIQQNVEYDPVTGNYVVTEKIGDQDFRPPTYMTFQEYMEWKRKQEEKDYFNSLSGTSSGKQDRNISILDPLAKMDLKSNLIDRLFGGTNVDIRPQGSIDLTFGYDYQKNENPVTALRSRRLGTFDFDMDIQVNVTGKIGEKLNLTTNYNTGATFNFDNQIKLDYNSDLFSEDDIIKKIEAGNVSLPLRGTLIQGAQSLFGIKTELQFGRLWLTGLVSQQNSKRENLQIQGGGQTQEFEVRADDYDENRHFFLSHYNRDKFEAALVNMPQISSLFKLENLEVWLTNDRLEVDNVRDIVALADLGEPVRITNPDRVPPFQTPRYREICEGLPLPDNEANGLYQEIVKRGERMREIDEVVSVLQSSQFGLLQSRDFEKVSARRLNPQEYTFHPELGFISVNINVQPDQVLAVSYQYSYNGKSFKVGELSINSEVVGTDTSNYTPKVLFVKMLKSTTQRTNVPMWDLMMKNVYSLGALQLSQQDFYLDVFYDDPGKGFKRFLPESNLAGQPLLRVFNLDRLNVQGDPTPDGVFDFVPGVTINPRTGRILFPVLEPFGSSLAAKIDDPELRRKLVFQELYDSTIYIAREYPEKNRFLVKGKYKSSVSSEYYLGGINIPRGSVRVSAGGQILREGADYEVDYGTGRLRILNDALLNLGVPINVSFEDNSLFGFQNKTMLGIRADYKIDKNFNVGGTFMKLFERPFTQKVNFGEDPINNNIYGLDLNLSREAPWLTKLVDAIPGIETNQPSNINVTAEAAYLKPGHARAINQNKNEKEGVVYIDDFEGSASGFDLRQPTNRWFLASVPQRAVNFDGTPLFPESELANSLVSGANRAKLSWYRVDPSARISNPDGNNPYTSQVLQEEVFRNAQIPPDQLPFIPTFDLTYYPNERGPYNFDTPEGFPGYTSGVDVTTGQIVLKDAKTRWAGVMRELQTNDFLATNIEFMEFWMLSPFLDPANPLRENPEYERQQGDLFINLGNISEDILRDSRNSFENGLPGNDNISNRRVDQTTWGQVPVSRQLTRSFDIDPEARRAQDVGLDGLPNEGERQKFSTYLQSIRSQNTNAAAELEKDPSGDDYTFYLDQKFDNATPLPLRYKDYNNTEGNSRENRSDDLITAGTNIPDAEDMNNDNTLNETEAYFQYQIPLRANRSMPREIDMQATPFITDTIHSRDDRRIWYRFRIPLNGPDKKAIGGIQDFRSIRFMRLYMKGFERPVTLRFARLELVRNQWRRYLQDLSDIGAGIDDCETAPVFKVDRVGIEENSSRTPFNYVLPLGIQREQSLGVFNTLQNEQSLSLAVEDLCDGGEKAIYKQIDLDMRVYEKLRMFVHAEEKNGDEIAHGSMSAFIRLGSDFKNNYYEYEIPLLMSERDNLPTTTGSAPNDDYKREVWRIENEFNFALAILTELKKRRNDANFPLGKDYVEILDPVNPEISHKIKVKGNPNLGYVKMAMIGIRNPYNGDGAAFDTEMWINELRLTGLDERGGGAAIARIDLTLADFGSITVAGNYSSIGFGALDQKVQQRARESVVGYDVATRLELGKFFPQDWGVRLPFYGQISNTVRTPEYDPYDLDIKLKDNLNQSATKEIRDSIKNQSQEIAKIKSFNFTDVGLQKQGGGQSAPKPWDISNFGFNYAYTESSRSDPIIESDVEKRYTGGFDYGFNRQVKYLEPFKGLKNQNLKLISEINFNPIPNSFVFSTVLDRRQAITKYRFTGLEDKFSTFYNKRFTWDRDYSMNWDIFKSLRLTFNATNSAVIDEPDEAKIAENPLITDPKQYRRDSIWEGLRDFGRTKNYRHNINVDYTVPIRHLPYMDWVQLTANLKNEYSWNAAALNTDSLGNVIQNAQNLQFTADLNFEGLYNKFNYLRKINQGKNNRQQGQQGNRPTPRTVPAPGGTGDKDKNKKDREPSALERALIRPLMMIRRVRVNYSEQTSTVVPGFMPQSKMLGMESGFGAPGWGFIAGMQPKIRTLDAGKYGSSEDWLYENRNWITPNTFFNQEVLQRYTQKFDARISVEPFRDFRIDITANRSYTEDHAEYFKDTLKNNIAEYVHAVPKQLGSLTLTYFSLNTLFQDSKEEIVGLFREFENNRVIISRRLGQGLHDDPNLAELGYAKGYGRTQQDVLIPAFIAAYTGKDANSVSLDLFSALPNINWSLNYNGLTRIPLFAEIFQNFTLRHQYQSTLSVNRFNTGFDYLRTTGGVNELNFNFYPRLEIPDLFIQEGFNPLISVQATTKTGLSVNMDVKKTRGLGMSFISNQLSETQSKEYVAGLGYRIRNLDIPFLTGSKKKGGGKKPTTQPQQPNQPGRGNQQGGQLQGQELDINFDFSLRDNVTFSHLLDQGIIEPTRGNYELRFSPSAQYQINRRLALRAFFDYNRIVPKTSAGFPRTDWSAGTVVRFTLN